MSQVGLSTERVVAAGVRVLRRDGIEALSLRSVAGALRVTPMALYRHVADAEALRHRVLDDVLRDLPHVAAVGRWQDRYRDWAHAARNTLVPYPGLPRHVLLHWTELPPVLRVVEQLLDAAPPGDAVAASNAVFTFVLLRVDAEQAFIRGDHLRRSLAAFGDDLPLLRANADEYAVARIDEHFAYQLDALLAGIAVHRRRTKGAHRADPHP